ncbi:MAG: hypothetical protein ABI851_07450 [Saprospiraceae bacterium]
MMKKVSKILNLLLFACLGTSAFAQTATDLSGFSTPNNTQAAVRCDIALPSWGFAANGNWLVSTRNANFVGPLASVELCQDFNVPAPGLSGQQIVSIDYIGQQVFGVTDFHEARFFSQVATAPGPQLFSTTTVIRAGGLVTYEFTPAWRPNFGTTYWTSSCGVNDPTQQATNRWEWDGTGVGFGTPAFVRFNPSGGWGGAACPYWTPKASCAFLATSGPPEQALRINICRSAQLVLGGNPVPTMTQWGLFLFGLVIVTLGIVTVYNVSRRKATV